MKSQYAVIPDLFRDLTCWVTKREVDFTYGMLKQVQHDVKEIIEITFTSNSQNYTAPRSKNHRAL
jgi:hypothetical protein